MSQTKVTSHIKSLGLLRGLAALSVCCFHVLSDAFNADWLKAVFSHGYLGLDLFFIISGFVIPYSMYQNNYSRDQFPKFLLKRSIRIEPPYIMSFILIILARLINISIHNHNFPSDIYYYDHDWTQFGLHFLYLNQYFGYESYTIVYWTLAIEFQFYLLIGFFYPLIIHSNKKISIAVLLFFCVLIFFLALPYNWFIFQYGYLFIAGILVFLFTIRHTSLRNFLILLSGLLILIYFKNGLDVFLITIFGVVSIINIRREWRITNFLGNISYSFYLVHLEAASWFIVYMRGEITGNTQLKVLAVLFAIAFATGFHYLFEKPALRLSKKIHYQTFSRLIKDQLTVNYKKILLYLVPPLLFLTGLWYVPSTPKIVERRISIRSVFNNKYLCADADSLVYANRGKASDWETFTMIQIDDNHCGIKAHSGLFLCTEMNKNQEISVTRNGIGNWETFTLEEMDDHIFAFKGANNKYLSVSKSNNQIFSLSDTLGLNESFEVKENLK